LLEQDDELVEIIRELKEAKGRGSAFGPKRLKEKIEVIGPSVNLDSLANSIFVEVIDRIGESWDESYGQLAKYKATHGHCRVPQIEFGKNSVLGSWVATQRRSRLTAKLSAERIGRLDKLDFAWDAFDQKWEEGFNALVSFKAREGHCIVPKGHVENGIQLGSWVRTKRDSKNKASLTTESIAKLNVIGFVWEPNEIAWEEGFNALASFKAREGHCIVPKGHVENGFNLVSWVRNQRTLKSNSKLSLKRINRLDELGFIWNTLAEKWNENFQALCLYKEQNGHCQVPISFKVNQLKLGAWVSTQRREYSSQKLSSARIEQLDALGFTWKIKP
jgi:hypothetical protein